MTELEDGAPDYITLHDVILHCIMLHTDGGPLEDGSYEDIYLRETRSTIIDMCDAPWERDLPMAPLLTHHVRPRYTRSRDMQRYSR